MNVIVNGLVKDKTAWIGGTSSCIATIVTKAQEVQLPVTMEGWAALALSVVTIFYILSKTFFLFWNNRKGIHDRDI